VLIGGSGPHANADGDANDVGGAAGPGLFFKATGFRCFVFPPRLLGPVLSDCASASGEKLSSPDGGSGRNVESKDCAGGVKGMAGRDGNSDIVAFGVDADGGFVAAGVVGIAIRATLL
jgi:hypothetical protein